MHRTSLLTYNLHYGAGSSDVPSLLNTYHPDICCFQETDIDEDFFILLKRFGYDLAGYSHSFKRLFHTQHYSIATFYKRERYTFINSRFYKLPRGIIEMAQVAAGVTENSRTVLQTQLLHADTKKPVYVYNVHLTAYSTNIARVKQIHSMAHVVKKHEQFPVFISGDLNYPYKRKKLERIFKEYGFSEASHNVPYTSIQNYAHVWIKRVKLDYMFYKNLSHVYTDRIPSCSSDHFPLYAQFHI